MSERELIQDEDTILLLWILNFLSHKRKDSDYEEDEDDNDGQNDIVQGITGGESPTWEPYTLLENATSCVLISYQRPV